MMNRILVGVILFFLAISFAFSQPPSKALDTVSIYRTKAGVRYQVYKEMWYPRAGTLTWFHKMNDQDNLVMNDSTPFYFKVYDRKNRLQFEGRKHSLGTNLQGEIKYYYKSGKQKKVEFREWPEPGKVDTAMLKEDDEFIAQKAWNYYRRNGKLKKQIEFVFNVCRGEPFMICYNGLKIKKYGRNKKLRSVRRRHGYPKSMHFESFRAD